MAAAENAGARVLLGFSHSRSRFKRAPQDAAVAAPLPREFLRFRARYPFVKEYLTWNEANHRGQPTWNHPKLVGRYYDILRNNCRECTIVGPVGARLDRDARLGQAGREGRQAPHRHLGAPQLHRRQPLPHARHALAAARDEGEDLVHRDRRAGAPRQRLDGSSSPSRRKHAVKATRWVLKLARLSPRVRRVYFYHWTAPAPDATWDSALIGPARPPAARLRGRADVRAPAARGDAPARRRARPPVRRRALVLALAAAARAAQAACGNREAIRGGGTTSARR